MGAFAEGAGGKEEGGTGLDELVDFRDGVGVEGVARGFGLVGGWVGGALDVVFFVLGVFGQRGLVGEWHCRC